MPERRRVRPFVRLALVAAAATVLAGCGAVGAARPQGPRAFPVTGDTVTVTGYRSTSIFGASGPSRATLTASQAAALAASIGALRASHESGCHENAVMFSITDVRRGAPKGTAVWQGEVLLCPIPGVVVGGGFVRAIRGCGLLTELAGLFTASAARGSRADAGLACRRAS